MLLLCTFSGLVVARSAARRGHCARGAWGVTIAHTARLPSAAWRRTWTGSVVEAGEPIGAIS